MAKSESNSKLKAKQKKKKEKLTVKIETVPDNPEKSYPIVGYFSSAYDPLKESAGEKPEAKVKVYKNLKRSNRYQVVVTPKEGSEVEFVGTNYAGEATAPQLCNYALGVLDKETQTLKVVPIAANKIFRLEPRVGGFDQPEGEPQDALTGVEKAEAVKNLHIKYSSSKTVREYKKRELLSLNDDAETQQDLERKIEHIKMNEEALEVAATTTSDDRNIPQYDLHATDPEMAYPLDKIIFKGEWDYLLDILKLSDAGAEASFEVYPSFVCNRVYKLETIKDDMEKRRLAGIFSYITHLIKYKDKYSMDGVRSAERHKIPGILFQKFSAMFGDQDLKRLSTEKIELLITYVLVLTLFVDDFRTDLSDIAKDLRMSPVKLRAYYEYLGCKLVRENQLLLATLPVPLQFPALRRKRRR